MSSIDKREQSHCQDIPNPVLYTMEKGRKGMLIRQETSKDYNAVYNLVKEAFASAEHSDGNEQDLVAALRNGAAFVPELSLIAEIDGIIAGHILFTEAKVGNDIVLVLAPLSVLPEFQKRGIGSALIKEGHKIARELGYQYSLVLGSETYYPRYGSLPAEQFGIEVPDGMPSVNFMAIKLQDNAKPVSGAVTYAKEFGI
ncbi:N-acetyltransferase [Paenibacillus sp. D2_2]|uniref:GNAT family N-acetyltransferase n=1 Tax=Paenibacillus sp. D2_2 TaxID=3073092 RepID=UPI002814B734|nr:N-acetyltransferase [Paenibacillus sp. D2_2]WMT42125.1 N-acetyltransferase [Paenibacillus sp. D2_2]